MVITVLDKATARRFADKHRAPTNVSHIRALFTRTGRVLFCARANLFVPRRVLCHLTERCLKLEKPKISQVAGGLTTNDASNPWFPLHHLRSCEFRDQNYVPEFKKSPCHFAMHTSHQVLDRIKSISQRLCKHWALRRMPEPVPR